MGKRRDMKNTENREAARKALLNAVWAARCLGRTGDVLSPGIFIEGKDLQCRTPFCVKINQKSLLINEK